jgi:ubiquinone/menaquinone biosynthesis C-methylase UbiE
MLKQEYETMRQVEDRHWWYSALRQMVLRDVQDLSIARPECNILDAGCGTGGMLSILQSARKGWHLHGIDASPEAVAFTKERGFSDTTVSCVNDLRFADNSQDIVLSLDVIYHEAVDETAALASLARVLKPGGALILNVAAFDILRGSHDIATHGARRYTPWRVKELVEKAGLTVQTQHCWNAWLFPVLLCVRLLSRLLPAADVSETRGDLSMVRPWINSALKRLAKADTQITRWLRLPIGTSVYVIARKPQYVLSPIHEPRRPHHRAVLATPAAAESGSHI